MTVVLESRLDRNLALLQRASPETAARIRAARPRADLLFSETDDGVPAVAIAASGGGTRALCSARRPLDEAKRLISRIDLGSTACIVVAGFGAGHHVAALARRLRRTGLIIVFEPDVALLRAVLERIDCSGWFAETNLVVLTDPDDAAAIAAATHGAEGLMAMGVELLEHPPSKQRLGSTTNRFYTNVTSLMHAVRTTVVTTLVQVRATLRNLTQNVDHYVRRPGISDLAGAAAGRPAIVVSAGPSLARNIELLARPGVRDRFVIVAVQTVLKPLLGRGIRPHFVTALDHHEISRRFYEGLTGADVQGVTLIAEPKANPAILEAWPGRLRLAQDSFLDALLGPGLSKARGSIAPGATVAHLAYSVARHLGCDPVILTGQDLGFTDGQYYAAGAAIHQVWAAELNEFRTLEMMEWERIVRGRSHLRPMRDTLGRPIYTDEQMHNYLVQFERDFRADAEKGRTIIDATEGGVAKSHTTVLPLAKVLHRYASIDQPLSLPGTPELAPNAPSLTRLEDRLRTVRRDVWKVGDLSRRAADKLAQMSEHHADQQRVNALIQQVHTIRDQVSALDPAYDLVQYLNQSGALNRIRADRAIHLDGSLDPLQRQRRQIERDQDNITRLAECADLLGAMLDEAAAAVTGAPRRTRDLPGDHTAATGSPVSSRPVGSASRHRPADRGTLAAIIPVDLEHGGLDPRTLQPDDSTDLLRITLRRLSRCRRVGRVILLTDDPERTRAVAAGSDDRLSTLEIYRIDLAPWRARRAALRPARLWAASCWRGGLANATVFDELFEPATIARTLDELDLPAALLIGPDYCFLDPALCDEVVLRHLDQPRTHRLTFSQAAPGLAGCVVERSLAHDLARATGQPGAGPWATLGAVLGYNPAAPIPDLIASPVCAAAPPPARDAAARLIADTPAALDLLRALGQRAAEATLDEILAMAAERRERLTPAHYQLELVPADVPSGPHRDPALFGQGRAREPMSLVQARETLEAIAGNTPSPLLTLFGAGDGLEHPDLGEIVAAAREAGIAGIHIRTDLACPPERLQALLPHAPDVISVDLLAHTAPMHRAVTGRDTFDLKRANLERLLAARRESSVHPTARHTRPFPWIVPRLTRCDAVYEEIEPFYDHWLQRVGCAVIDPLPAARPGERIAPLPLPSVAAGRLARTIILSDGATLRHDAP